jgi:Na+-driven multidrug efflux pump
VGAALGFAVTEAIGLAAAIFPQAWLSLFGHDPAMIAAGSLYLRTAGPFFGCFGGGLVLYFASQGAGRLAWPVTAQFVRLLVAVGGAWAALRLGFGVGGVFAAIALGLASYGATIATAIAAGAWFTGRGEGRRVGGKYQVVPAILRSFSRSSANVGVSIGSRVKPWRR